MRSQLPARVRIYCSAALTWMMASLFVKLRRSFFFFFSFLLVSIVGWKTEKLCITTTNWYGAWRRQKPLKCYQRNYSVLQNGIWPKILILTSFVVWKESIRFGLIFITKIPAWCFSIMSNLLFISVCPCLSNEMTVSFFLFFPTKNWGETKDINRNKVSRKMGIIKEHLWN